MSTLEVDTSPFMSRRSSGGHTITVCFRIRFVRGYLDKMTYGKLWYFEDSLVVSNGTNDNGGFTITAWFLHVTDLKRKDQSLT